VEVALELFVILEAQAMDDTYDCCRIRVEPLGQRAHAQEHVFARMLENWTNDFLAFGTELLDSLRQQRGAIFRSRRFAHSATTLPDLSEDQPKKFFMMKSR
jgi:hypothetical protein